MSESDTFFTVVGCMDGRCQEPVDAYGKEKFHALYPDTITEAGIDGLLPLHQNDGNLVESLKEKLLISIQKHHSRGIVVEGHEDCAGNPVDSAHHKEHIKQSVILVKQLIDNSIDVVGVYLRQGEKEWVVEEVV